MEFLVRTDLEVPPDMEPALLTDLRRQERAQAMNLRAQGVLKRLWRLPGRRGTLGLYEVSDATHLHAVLSALPLWAWMDVTIEALATHPQEASDLAQMPAETALGLRSGNGLEPLTQ
jgi:muconolactone D-isomerase